MHAERERRRCKGVEEGRGGKVAKKVGGYDKKAGLLHLKE